MLRVLLITGLAVLATGCNWVKPITGSEQVRLLTGNQIQSCKKLGSTTSFVKHKVAGIERSRETVMEELVILGKNQATEMGGNAIVSQGAMQNGRIKFHIYRCP